MQEAQRLQEQIAYYSARAGEYDEWFFRRGRFDRGAENNAHWFAEVAEVAAALDAFQPVGDVLELACGTGIWTERLARRTNRLVVVDASAEVLAINRERLSVVSAKAKIEHRQADIFSWQPARDERFDTIFFSFWLSHVPPERFDEFWSRLRAWLKPNGGRVFFLDSRREPTSTAMDHVLPAPSVPVMQRRLNDGRTFEIYKIFYEAAPLTARLAALGWCMEIRETARYFVFGSGTPSA